MRMNVWNMLTMKQKEQLWTALIKEYTQVKNINEKRDQSA